MKLWCTLAFGILAVIGCSDVDSPDIRHYKVPRLEASVRLLAAIVPHAERVWFFRLSGPAEAVAEHKTEFDTFIRSLQFTDGAEKPVMWTVPEGWRESPGGGQLRYASFRMGAKDKSLELTVVPLGKEAASIVDNVNRWRGQLGLKPIGEAELPLFCTTQKVGDVEVTIVDMSGAGSATPPAPMAPMAPPIERPSKPKLEYRVPEGWKEQKSVGDQAASFIAYDGENLARTTVSMFPGPAGGLLANVNRWRDQVKLPPIDEEQLRRDAREIRVNGLVGQYVDLVGKDMTGQRTRILAVTVPREGQTWFIKMMGSAELVGKQQGNFETFVESIKFGGEGVR